MVAEIARRARQSAHCGENVKAVGDGVFEMRVDVGPGYRVYFSRRTERIVLLLCGGDKSSQVRDITRARILARTLEG